MSNPTNTRHTRLPLRSFGATGVRFPRPCPVIGCGVAIGSARERVRHLALHFTIRATTTRGVGA